MSDLEEVVGGLLGCLLGLFWIALTFTLPTLIGLVILDWLDIVDVW